MLEVKELAPIHVMLDEYKVAWMKDSDLSRVAAKKIELRKQVEELFPRDTAEALEYFDHQCNQIQLRHGRPMPGRSIH